MSTPTQAWSHRLRPMTGRDINEEHRGATPLELLYDLTFVVAFGQAADQLAHQLSEGHLTAGLVGFGFAVVGICWAWINFSWFSSAYDTDDLGLPGSDDGADGRRDHPGAGAAAGLPVPRGER